MRGAREPSQTGVRAAHLACTGGPPRRSDGASPGLGRSELRPWPGGQIVRPGYRERSLGGSRSDLPGLTIQPEGGMGARGLVSDCDSARRSATGRVVSLAGRSPKRETRGPSVGRSRSEAFAGHPRETRGCRVCAEARTRWAERPVRGFASRARDTTEVGSGCAEDTQREFDDTFPGVRPLSAKSARAIVSVSDCLPDTVRPQGFSPSRRFDPARASWVCFTPHPPIGFWPSELFPRGQPSHLSVCVALMLLD